MKSIRLFFLLILSTVTFGSTNYCKLNGYSASRIYHQESAIIKALQNNNAAELVDQVHYPLRINLANGSYLVTTPSQFIHTFDKLFTPADRTKIAFQLSLQPKQVICRSEGVGLLNGGLWLNPNTLKLMSINYDVIPHTDLKPDQPYGHAVKPITSPQMLKQFVKLYNKYQQTIGVDHPLFFITKVSPHIYQLSAKDNSGTIQLYYADINNSGQKDYILVYEKQGSLHTDHIQYIGYTHGNSLQPLQLKKLIYQTYSVKADHWYLFHSTPFLTTRGLTYLNYSSNGVICTYLWKAYTIRLVSRDNKNCITNSRNNH